MRLAEKNIKFVKCIEFKGVPYSWYVAMKSGNASDSRNFVNYENGKTICAEYALESLPAAVKKFVAAHDKNIFSKINDDFINYIYK